MDEDEAAEIRQGFLNLRNDWLRRRIFNAASTYLVLEAIRQRGEDRDTAPPRTIIAWRSMMLPNPAR